MGDVVIRASGPLFDGQARHELDAAIKDISEAVGQQAYSNVMTNLNASIKHPTPYYETQILVQNFAADTVVHDRGIVYGPWLEGTGSRNRTTRFKGYHSFRRAAQKTEREADRIAEHALEPHLRRMQ